MNIHWILFEWSNKQLNKMKIWKLSKKKFEKWKIKWILNFKNKNIYLVYVNKNIFHNFFFCFLSVSYIFFFLYFFRQNAKNGKSLWDFWLAGDMSDITTPTSVISFTYHHFNNAPIGFPQNHSFLSDWGNDFKSNFPLYLSFYRVASQWFWWGRTGPASITRTYVKQCLKPFTGNYLSIFSSIVSHPLICEEVKDWKINSRITFVHGFGGKFRKHQLDECIIKIAEEKCPQVFEKYLLMKWNIGII